MINLFCTPIDIITNTQHKLMTALLPKYCEHLSEQIASGGKNWVAQNLKNSFNTYNIYKDKNFEKINNFITSAVYNYIRQIGHKQLDLKKTQAWYNIYNKQSFQEWHNHNFALASCIYYLKSDENSSKTLFKNPLPDNPNQPDLDLNNMYTWEHYKVNPQEGDLVIFPSSLDHCVEMHMSDITRISLAYNFYTCN